MAYIDRELLLKDIGESVVFTVRTAETSPELRGARKIIDRIENAPTADVVEVVRCKDCKHSREFDKHCEINRFAHRHCAMDRGEEIKNVWHKYKKYYKDYSVVDYDGFCDYGEMDVSKMEITTERKDT